jgi:hypothetical protein
MPLRSNRHRRQLLDTSTSLAVGACDNVFIFVTTFFRASNNSSIPIILLHIIVRTEHQPGEKRVKGDEYLALITIVSQKHP